MSEYALTSYLQERVEEFHAKMGQADPAKPVDLTPEQRMKRAGLVAEEPVETVMALVGYEEARRLFLTKLEATFAKRGPLPGDLAEIADGCVDTMVVCAGTLSEAGIADVPLIEAVMDANDAKVGGGVDAAGKWQKPAGWTPPDIAGLLRAQGWGGGK